MAVSDSDKQWRWVDNKEQQEWQEKEQWWIDPGSVPTKGTARAMAMRRDSNKKRLKQEETAIRRDSNKKKQQQEETTTRRDNNEKRQQREEMATRDGNKKRWQWEEMVVRRDGNEEWSWWQQRGQWWVLSDGGRGAKNDEGEGCGARDYMSSKQHNPVKPDVPVE